MKLESNIPVGWKIVSIEQVRDHKSPHSYTGGPFGSNLKSEHYTEEGIRVILLQNIGDGKFLDNYKIFTSVEKANELISSNIYPGEIIISKMAEPLARACFIPFQYPRFLMCSDGIRLKVDKGKYCDVLILNLINHYRFRKKAELNSSGTTRGRIGLNELRNIPFILPKSLPEQKKIAEVLITIDNTIEKTEQIIEKLKNIKKGLMHDLFTRGVDENGQLRPTYDEAPHLYKESELGWIPKEWEVECLDEFAEITKLAGFEFTNVIRYVDYGEIIALRALNIKNEKLILSDIKRITKKASNLLPRSKVNKGDILITYIGAYIGDILLIDESDKYHLAPNVGKITIQKDTTPEFMELLLRSQIMQTQMINLTAITATPSLTMGQIRNLKCLLPTSNEEQKQIASQLHGINLVIEENRKLLEKYTESKQGLMEDLLTGKVRVNSLLEEEASNV